MGLLYLLAYFELPKTSHRSLLEKAKYPTVDRTLQIRNKIVTYTGIGHFRTVNVYIRFTTGVVHGRETYEFASILCVLSQSHKTPGLSLYTILHILALIA
jgi:hypothetical protein